MLLVLLDGLVYLQYTILAWPRMRPTVFHSLVSWPASTQFTAVLLSVPILPVLAGLPCQVLCGE